MIPIYVPFLQKYKKSAINAIEENWISNYGVNISNAEEKLCNILGVKYCILMNNGTAATHALFVALKHFHPSIKKIYVPNNVFIACWNCALMEYSHNEIEVLQTNNETLNMETTEEYIQSLEKDSAILVVHNLGNVVNVPRLKRLRPDIIFLEDNCEGLFGKYENKYSGSYKDTFCSCASFYANKTLTTGEGGAFFTNNKEIYEFMRSTYSHGMTTTRYIHDRIA
ncbi:DegT/DnrJ/EryC1/StrS family aminotransferase, partial [bacterium]|nr:DegT/DnrJ/EryC1/StrS family aminotransferase [bacterium]